MNKEKRIKKLINFIKQHPSLYNNRSNLFNCYKRKQIIWNQFENDGNRTKSSWRNLLCNYKRERKNLELRNRGNPMERYEPVYPYYYLLDEFLHNMFDTSENDSVEQSTSFMNDNESTSSSDKETDFDGDLIDLTSDTENENKLIFNQAQLKSLNKSSMHQIKQLKTNDQASSSKMYQTPSTSIYQKQPTKIHQVSSSKMHQASSSKMHQASSSKMHQASSSKMHQASSSKMYQTPPTKIHQNQYFRTDHSQIHLNNQIPLSYETTTNQINPQYYSNNQMPLFKKEVKSPTNSFVQQNSIKEDIKPQLNVKLESQYDFNTLSFKEKLLNNQDDHITNFLKSLIPQLKTVSESNSIEFEKLKIAIHRAIIKSLETCKK